jgi:hypothetical protein
MIMNPNSLNLPGYTGQSSGSYGTDYLGQAANMASRLQNLGVNTAQTSGGGFSDFLGDIFGGVQQIGSAISPAMPAIAGSLLTKEAYDRLSNVGDTAYQRSMDLAERGQQESQFRPFTVTTPTGSAFTARMGGQPQPPMLTGGPVAPPAGVYPIQPVTGGPVAPPAGIMPPMNIPFTNGNEFNRRMEEEVRRLNPGLFGQPVTGGPTAVPRFDTELNRMPGTVMDGGGAFGSGQGRVGS